MFFDKNIRNYNVIQGRINGIPLDPLGNKKINAAVKVLARFIKSNGFEENKEEIPDLLEHSLRTDGPYYDLSFDERQRAKMILLDYFGVG